MRRVWLVGILLLGKGLDAVSTVVVLNLSTEVEEVIPLSRMLMAEFGPAPGMVLLTLITLVIVALLAEFGLLVERLLPEVTPTWYADGIRTSIYLVTAFWFGAIGIHNFLLLF